MTVSTPIEVKVIYGRGQSSPNRALAGGVFTRVAAGLVGLIVLGGAGALYYGTWWHANASIGTEILLHTPLVGWTKSETAELDRMFGLRIRSADRARRARATKKSPEATTQDAAPTSPGLWSSAPFDRATAATLIPAVGYGWLGLSSMACCALALAAGGAFSAIRGRHVRVLALCLFGLTVLSLGAGGFYVWKQFGEAYPVWASKGLVGGLMLLGMLLGLGVGRGGRVLVRLGGLVVIISALGSVAGLHIWWRCNVIDASHVASGFLWTVFWVHSGLGWLLMLLAFLLPRPRSARRATAANRRGRAPGSSAPPAPPPR